MTGERKSRITDTENYTGGGGGGGGGQRGDRQTETDREGGEKKGRNVVYIANSGTRC